MPPTPLKYFAPLFVAAALAGCDSASPESPNGLVAWWSFNDELTADNSGNGFDVAAYGAASDEGIIGRAAALTGADYLVADTGPAFENEARSLSLWFYKASGLIAGDYESLVWQTETPGTDAPALTLDIRGATAPFDLHFAVKTADGQLTSLTADQSVSPGRWHHIVAVASNDGLRLYVDQTRSEAALLPARISATDTPLVFGKTDAATASPRFFNGRFDEIRLYNRALVQDDVNRLYSEAD